MSASGLSQKNSRSIQEVILKSNSDAQALERLKALGLKENTKRAKLEEIAAAVQSKVSKIESLQLKADYEAIVKAEEKASLDPKDKLKESPLSDPSDLLCADEAAMLLATASNFINCIVLLLDNGADDNLTDIGRKKIIASIKFNRDKCIRNKSFTFVNINPYQTALRLLGDKNDRVDTLSAASSLAATPTAAPERSQTPPSDSLINQCKERWGGEDGYSDCGDFDSASATNSRHASIVLALPTKTPQADGSSAHLRTASRDSFGEDDSATDHFTESLPEMTDTATTPLQSVTPSQAAPISAAGSHSATPGQASPISAASSRSATPRRSAPPLSGRHGSHAQPLFNALRIKPVDFSDVKRTMSLTSGSDSINVQFPKKLTVALPTPEITPCPSPRAAGYRDSISSVDLQNSRRGTEEFTDEALISAPHSPLALGRLSQTPGRDSADSISLSASGEDGLISVPQSPTASPTASVSESDMAANTKKRHWTIPHASTPAQSAATVFAGTRVRVRLAIESGEKCVSPTP